MLKIRAEWALVFGFGIGRIYLFEALVLRILREREEKYSNNFAVWEMLFNFVVGKRE